MFIQDTDFADFIPHQIHSRHSSTQPSDITAPIPRTPSDTSLHRMSGYDGHRPSVAETTDTYDTFGVELHSFEYKSDEEVTPKGVVRRQRSLERTRTWAEEIQRQRQKDEKRVARDVAERKAKMTEVYGDMSCKSDTSIPRAFMSRRRLVLLNEILLLYSESLLCVCLDSPDTLSSDVIDALVDDLGPTHVSPPLRTASASIESTRNRYRPTPDLAFDSGSEEGDDEMDRDTGSYTSRAEERGLSPFRGIATPVARSSLSEKPINITARSLSPFLLTPAPSLHKASSTTPLSPPPRPKHRHTPLNLAPPVVIERSHSAPARTPVFTPADVERASGSSKTAPSIADIIARHSASAANAEAAAKAKARRELAQTAPISDAKVTLPPIPSTTHSRRHRKRSGVRSPIPVRTSSSPGATVHIISPRLSSRTTNDTGSLTSTMRTSESSRTSHSLSLRQNVSVGQALLDRLENGSIPSTPSGSVKRVSFALTPNDLTARLMLLTPLSTSPEVPEDVQMARYLRSPHLNRVITVGAQRVSVSEIGPATGKPILFFLGLGCVRYMIALFDQVAEALGLRLICIDRWGYGKTDTVPEDERTVVGWARVVEAVLDELRVDDFGIVAHSAGAPYALALVARLPHRVRGSVHLLAPWVNADLDGGEFLGAAELIVGYKWLKWVPNGLIKAALMADWHYTSRSMGEAPQHRHKPTGISHESLSPTVELHGLGLVAIHPPRDSPTPSRKPSLMRRASQALMGTPPSLRSVALRKATGTPVDRETSASPAPSEVSVFSSAANRTLASPKAIKTGLNYGLVEGFDPISPLPHASSSTSKTSTPKPPMTSSLLETLSQASHAECEPGTTLDILQIILGRSHVNASADPVTRAWGFSLCDVKAPVKMWWGAKDEKVTERGVRWLERAVGGEVVVLGGMGHNLMSRGEVMVDVLSSFERWENVRR